MTDNEIIRCLRFCRAGDCENCKALDVCDATFSFHKEALDLINRQKAENESLKADLAKCSIMLDNLYKTADETKSEAIKEFAVNIFVWLLCVIFGYLTGCAIGHLFLEVI